jgi:hypothetical protein
MPRIPSDEEIQNIKPGTYLVKIVEVKTLDQNGEPRTSKNGDIKWILILSIISQGEYWGREVRDHLIFSSKFGQRNKSLLYAFGFDTSVGLDLSNPDVLIGRQAMAEVVIESYNNSPQSKVRFFGGYRRVEDAKPAKSKEDEDIPF